MLKVLPIKKIFIKRMMISTLMQFFILAIIFLLVKHYIFSNERENISNILTINDSFTREELTKYRILDNNYAFDLSLRSIADERKLDAIWFADSVKSINGECEKIKNDHQYMICTGKNGVYYGITPLNFNHGKVGYVIATKKYSFFSEPFYYGLVTILIAVIGAFLFDFLFLFLSIKNSLEKNTDELLEFISASNQNEEQCKEINIEEYLQIAQKFVEKRNEISCLERERSFNHAMKKLAAQVAHDIRSPLLAVDSFFHLIENKLDESERIFGNRAISRLNDIAWSLLSKYKKKEEHASIGNSYVFLSSCIQEILSEKRMEYAKGSIEFAFVSNPADAFCLVHTNAMNLKRMLSNLINNAVNAILPKAGLIEISLKGNMFGRIITIKDNGCGMKSDVMKDLLESARNENEKTNLGLPHAVKFLESIGGKLEMESIEGKGTIVSASLPYCEAPAWCLNNYQVADDELILIIDDSQSVHDVWNEMLKKVPNVKYKHLYSPDEASIFFKKHNKKSSTKLVIFCDYEFFNAAQNGLDILSFAPEMAKKFLVTSHLYDPKIMQAAIDKGFNIIPKDLVPYFHLNKHLSITFTEEISLIFIDNEKYNRDNWEFFAKRKKMNIATYSSVEDFLKKADQFNRETSIYIDLDLGMEKNGIEYAKDLYSLGFRTIYIATGAIDDKLKKEDYPWLMGIRDKKFPKD